MEIVSLINDIVPIRDIVLQLWRWGQTQASYCIDLAKDLEMLRNKRTELSVIKEDVRDIIMLAEQRQSQPKNGVNDWLKSVEGLLTEAGELVARVEREVDRQCLGCPQNCVSSYSLGREVRRRLNEFDQSFETDPGFECYCIDLKTDLGTLRKRSNELNNIYKDEKDIVELAKQLHEEPKNEANGWLHGVEDRFKDANELLEKGGQEVVEKCSRLCSIRNCASSFKLEKEVKRMLIELDWSREKERGFQCYCIDLAGDLDRLRTKSNELNDIYKDEKDIAELAKQQQSRSKNEANCWLQSAEARLKDAEQLLNEGEHISKKCRETFCPKNCASTYELGKEVKKWLIESSKRDRCFECYCVDLEGDLNELNIKREKLNNLYEDVKNRVKQAERKQCERTNEVNGWLQSVEACAKVADKLQEKGEQEVSKKCLRRCHPKDCVSSYELGKEVKKRLIEFNRHIDRGRHFESATIAARSMRPSLEERPVDKAVGMETLFEDVWRWVESESVRMIGIYGMGGIGKTTLLTKIYNQLVRVAVSDCKSVNIFFIEVGEKGDPEKIQKCIWRKLHISNNEWEEMDRNDRATRILSLLSGERSLLFLDDIWQSIDVHKDIGIPRPEDDKSKVIFTTRFEPVCDQMRAHKKYVPILPPHKARQLFEECVGKETVEAVGNTPEFDQIIKECNRLPLAIKTVGKAMVRKTSLDYWDYAIDELKNSSWNFPKMKDEVLKLLKFSYERLPDETHRRCFLSCALYPEDYRISREGLIELWVAEGLLDAHIIGRGVRKARSHRKLILSNLIEACMLEATIDLRHRDAVQMHDLIRDMALWIIKDEGASMNKILVQEPFDPERWEAAEKIAFWDSKLELTLSVQSFFCPKLLILILHDADIRSIPFGFFAAMPALEVLDLQGNMFLDKLPDDIGDLINLQSLDLSRTKIRLLPMKMEKLKKLRHLWLPYVHIHVPKELISNFMELRVFGWRQYDKDRDSVDAVNFEDEVAVIEVLQGLKFLCEVSLILWNSECVKKVLTCPKLLNCASSLDIRESFEFWSSYIRSSLGSSSSSAARTMEHLRFLNLESPKTEENSLQHQLLSQCGPNQVRPTGNVYFPILTEVTISHCGALVDLTLLIYNAPRLEKLEVQRCSSLREVIGGEIEENDASKLFASLTDLKLVELPCLNSICKRTLSFPLIKYIRIQRCPNLRMLPLSGRVVSSLRSIEGERDWWEALQWDNQRVKPHILKQRFHVI